MDNFPNNSHKAKDEGAKPDKKIEKVIEGEVTRRKKPLGKRFAESMLAGEDAHSVMGFVVMDILLPAAKDMMADAVSQGFERMIYGEVKSTSRRGGHRPSGSSGYVSYNRFSSPSRREDSRPLSRRSRASHDFDEIIIETRVEAEAAIDGLFEIVSKYDAATVADLYELVGVSGNYTDDKWGWTGLRGASVTRVRGGYLLDLPKPEPLD